MFESLQGHMDEANSETGAEPSVETSSEQGESTSTESEETTNTSENLSDQLDSMEVEASTEAGSFLDQINALNIVRNGLPHSFDNPDDIKEYLSKGLDYTLKTQEHADAIKAFKEESDTARSEIEQERQAFEEQKNGLQTGIQEHNVLLQMFTDFAKTDPELFEQLDAQFQQSMGQFEAQQNNPLFNQMNTQMSELRQEIDSFKEQGAERENENIRKGWEDELTQVQTEYGAKLKSIGVTPDWAKVQNIWSSDSTGQMDVKGALFAAHGEHITKGLESSKKLAETKSRSNQRMGQDGEGDPAPQGDAPFDSTNYQQRMQRMERLASKHTA
jgi:hypothetical protein